MNVAFTGHRPNKFNNDYELVSGKIQKIKARIVEILTELQKEDDVTGVVGMALGIDTLAAITCVGMKIPFIAAVPCKSQDSKWPERSRMIYKQLLLKAQQIVLVTDSFYNYSVMQKRNEWMVDNSEVLIAVWDGSKGGTGNCVQYAKSKNKRIIYINPDDFQ